jgi:hypothetical protein
MKKPFKVRGDPENGHNITVPMSVKPKAGDKYDFRFVESGTIDIRLPAGTLVYIPARAARSARSDI